MSGLKVFIVGFILLFFGFNVQAQSQWQQDLESFRAWMTRKALQGDSITRAEWPAIKESFRSKTANLDRNTDSMPQESKEEYTELKLQYRSMESKYEEQYGQPLNRAEAVKWEKELAGRTNLKTIKPAELRDVFTYFLEGVRGQRINWSLRDWEYAEHVYLELSSRKQVVLDRLSTGDKIKIAALQVEFNTLRKSRDAKDKYNEMRESH